MAKLLADKVADRLAIITGWQQIGKLLQQLARRMRGLHLRQACIQKLLSGRKVACQQARIVFYPNFMAQSGPKFG